MEIGTNVKMNDNYFVSKENEGMIFKVKSKVVVIGGTECVMLKGYSGAYALDGLTEVKND